MQLGPPHDIPSRPTFEDLATFVRHCDRWSLRTQGEFQSAVVEFEKCCKVVDHCELSQSLADSQKHNRRSGTRNVSKAREFARRSALMAKDCSNAISSVLLRGIPPERLGKELHPATEVLLTRGADIQRSLDAAAQFASALADEEVRAAKLDPFRDVPSLRLTELAKRARRNKLGLGDSLAIQLQALRHALEAHRSIRPAAMAFFHEVGDEPLQAPVSDSAAIDKYRAFWAVCVSALRVSDAARHAPLLLLERRKNELERMASGPVVPSANAAQAAENAASALIAEEDAECTIRRVLSERKRVQRERANGAVPVSGSLTESSESDDGGVEKLVSEVERVHDAAPLWRHFSALTSRPETTSAAFVALLDRIRAGPTLTGLRQLVVDDIRRIAADEYAATFERVWKRRDAAAIHAPQSMNEASLHPTHVLNTFTAYFGVESLRTAFMQHLQALEHALHAGLAMPLDAARKAYFFDSSVRFVHPEETLREFPIASGPRFYPFPREYDSPGTACIVGLTEDGTRLALQMRVPFDEAGEPNEVGRCYDPHESAVMSLEVYARSLLYAASDKRGVQQFVLASIAELVAQLSQIEQTGDLTLWHDRPSVGSA